MVAPPIWERPRLALVAAPALETLFGLLTPLGGLGAPFSIVRARREHESFRRTLERFGVVAVDLREAFFDAAPVPRETLEALARAHVAREAPDAALSARIDATVAALDPSELVDLILLRPAVSADGTGIAIDPLPATLRIGDTLLATPRGVVLTRPVGARAREAALAGLAALALGREPVAHISDGPLDSRDVAPAGDLVYVREGPTSHAAGIAQFLALDPYPGATIVQIRGGAPLPLDAILTLIDETTALVRDDLVGDAEPECVIGERRVPLRAFFAEREIRVIPVAPADAAALGGLALGGGTFALPGGLGAPLYERLRDEGIALEPLSIDALSNAGVTVRSLTAVLERSGAN